MRKNTNCPRQKRHKMALLTFLGLLLPVQVVPSALHALLPNHPLIAALISVAALVGMMSYVIMPILMRMAGDWLYQ